MKLQLALDTVTPEEAIDILKEAGGYVDIIEIGTPLIIKEGVGVIRMLRDKFPDITLLADVKIMDGGRLEAAYAFEAGADIVTVLAAAEDETVKNVIEAARKHGKKSMVDMIAIKDIEKRAAEIDAFKPDYICVHTAVDVQHTGRNPMDELIRVKKTLKNAEPAVAGGLNLETIGQALSAGPEILVVGGAIEKAKDRAGAAREFKKRISGI